ncbi:MAG: hypothetical protein NT027_07425 [Proteobacteria bacterium]|nr:hypothetical protein [Pseudomonadota bacterium]
MMANISWLTTEAQRLHGYFSTVFYMLVATFLLLGVLMEYFKFPLGQLPSFAVLVGRAGIAILLLIAYPEIANTVSSLTDSLATGVGGFDNLDGVLQKMGDKIDGYSSDWLSARSLIMTVLSILTYTFLFYSVIIAEAAHVFTWTLLYVFSPILIAFYVLPSTAPATASLFRSMIEVCFWKIVWCVLAALLWASVLIDINSTGTLDFVKMICINLMLGGSLIATPWVVHALASTGLTGFTRNFSGVVTAAGFMTPLKAVQIIKNTSDKGVRGFQRVKELASRASRKSNNPSNNRSNKFNNRNGNQ